MFWRKADEESCGWRVVRVEDFPWFVLLDSYWDVLIKSDGSCASRYVLSPSSYIPLRIFASECFTQTFVRIRKVCRSQWLRGLRRRSVSARLLRSWVRIPPGAWMFVCCECYVLSGRGLCDELITRPEESYRLCCVVVCDQETSRMRRPWPALGRSATGKQKKILRYSVRATWPASLILHSSIPAIIFSEDYRSCSCPAI